MDLATQQPYILINREYGENATLKIEAVRELIGDSATQGNAEQPVYYLLLHLEKSSVAAQNALLKLLEEPPAGARFILSTSDLNAVVETIHSRCQIIHGRGGEGESQISAADLEPFLLGELKKSSHSAIIAAVEATLKKLRDNYQTQLDQISAEESATNLDRRATKALLTALSAQYRQDLTTNNYPAPKILIALQVLQTAFLHLEANVNPKFLLENCFFEIKKQFTT